MRTRTPPRLSDARGLEVLDDLTVVDLDQDVPGVAGSLPRDKDIDVSADDLRAGVAVHPARSWVEACDDAVQRLTDDGILGVLEDRGHLLSGLECVPLLGHLACCGDHQQDVPGVDVGRVDVEKELTAILMASAQLQIESEGASPGVRKESSRRSEWTCKRGAGTSVSMGLPISWSRHSRTVRWPGDRRTESPPAGPSSPRHQAQPPSGSQAWLSSATSVSLRIVTAGFSGMCQAHRSTLRRNLRRPRAFVPFRSMSGTSSHGCLGPGTGERAAGPGDRGVAAEQG